VHFGNMFCKLTKCCLLSIVILFLFLLFDFYLCIKDMLDVGEVDSM
jgi:hypothetical protein